MPDPTHAAVMRLAGSVRALGGVARVNSLLTRGHSRHYIRLGLDQGVVARVARNRVAVPDADPELVSAARAGVVLTCITQARRRGLWVLDEDRCHVGAQPHDRSAQGPTMRVHWGRPLVPRHPDDLVDPIENVLALVAACQPYEAALAVWESALNQRLVDIARLRRLPFRGAARRLVEEAHPFADSGLETLFAARLRWTGQRILAQVWIAGRRVDHLIGERLVVQIDGGHHVDAQRASDNAHDAALRLLGYTVIRVGYHEIIRNWAAVQALILQAIAQGLHRP